jgi:hypothetical protein
LAKFRSQPGMPWVGTNALACVLDGIAARVGPGKSANG